MSITGRSPSHAVYVISVAAELAGMHPQTLRIYERRGLVRFSDPRLREGLFALLTKPPSVPVPPERVDFTPYWKLPIPPSYFPD